MDELLEAAVEAGVEIAATGSLSKKGCMWTSIILALIAIGVTLYFVL